MATTEQGNALIFGQVISHLIDESKKLYTFCALHSAAREINSRSLHARVPP
jgi:hypothetical protein